ncbi:MAG: glucokinase [Thermodesulfobacteriota bacterium]
MVSKIILAGDIGGTKTRLGLYHITRKRRYQTLFERTFQSRDYQGLDKIFHQFLQKEGKIDVACLGVAAPIIGNKVKLTNLPWVIDIKTLKRKLGVERLSVINDLVANAFGLRMLKRKDLVTLNRGKRRVGNAAIISAGTGLGEAILFWDGKNYQASPSEGGHVEFGPRNPLEIELLKYLLKSFDHVSYERILTGEGLFRIYQFLRDIKKTEKDPLWLIEKMEREDPASVISQAAHDRKSPPCMMALDIFSSIYGAEAGNLALKAMAIGGVYIGGGIAPRILWKLREGIFMEAFKDKGRYSKMMKEIPVKVIMNERAGLLGALSHAMDLLEE